MFQDKVAIITGGANGIGKAIAEALFNAGAKVAIADRDEDGAIAVGAACGGFGAKVDATSETEIKDFIDLTCEKLGKPDIIIANAGVVANDGSQLLPAGDNDKGWNLSWQLNVMSAVYLARHGIPIMKENGGGIFATTASAAGLLNQMGAAPYTVTKHGVVAFTETLSIAHHDEGIKVHCICPQGVRTDLIKGGEKTLELAGEILEVEQVAQIVLDGFTKDKFYIETSPEIREFAINRVSQNERWLGHMRKFRKKLLSFGIFENRA